MEITCPLCADASSPSTVWFRKDGCDIFSCPACTVRFRWPLPAASDVQALYGMEYFHDADGDLRGSGYLDYIADEPCHRRNARRRLRMLDALLSERKTLFDAGCAAGFFLREAVHDDWRAEGVDLSVEMSAYARTSLGLAVTTGAFTQTPIPPQSLDAVTMWDYLEHTRELLQELSHAHACLRTGGVLMLSTGDASSLVARFSGKRWHLLTPRHHFFYFTPLSIRRALERAGFSDITITHPGAAYSLRYLLHKLRLPFGSLVPRTWCVSVNLGDIMTVSARA